MLDIDTEKMKQEILKNIKRIDASSNASFSSNGKLLYKTKGYRLAIEVNSRWVGYDLEVTDSNLPKKMRPVLSDNTDLYPLDKEYTKATTAVYEGLLSLLDDLVNKDIYYSVEKKVIYIAKSSKTKDMMDVKEVKKVFWKTYEVKSFLKPRSSVVASMTRIQ